MLQIDSFLEGFHSIVPTSLISIFDISDLELLICGLPDIDIEDLHDHTTYHGYKRTDQTIEFFWNTLRRFTEEEKALFIQFVTGPLFSPI